MVWYGEYRWMDDDDGIGTKTDFSALDYFYFVFLSATTTEDFQ